MVEQTAVNRFYGGSIPPGPVYVSKENNIMSIKSTVTITREQAISRIQYINSLIENRSYRTFSRETHEPESDARYYIDCSKILDLSHIEEWTNEMLESQMDKPFFRHFMFQNYIVE